MDRLALIEHQISRAIAADHAALERVIAGGNEGQREWLVAEIAGLQDALDAIRRSHQPPQLQW